MLTILAHQLQQMYHTCVRKVLTAGETGRGRGKMETVLSAQFFGKPKTTLKSKVY